MIVSVPVSTPVVVGLNLALTRQLRPGAKLVPQLVLSDKLALHAKLMPVIVVVPTFESVTVCAALFVPTSWFPNNSEKVLRLSPETT